MTVEERRAYHKKWRDTNPELVRVSHRRRNQRLKLLVLGAYGGKCAECGETEPMRLTLDHIEEDGGEHRAELSATGMAVYRDVKRRGYPPGFQILCWNHHFKKSRAAMLGGATAAAKSMQGLRPKVFIGYGEKCALCPCSDPDVMVLDHVGGGGRQDRKKKSWAMVYREAIRESFPPRFRLLCAGCNGENGIRRTMGLPSLDELLIRDANSPTS